MGIDRVTSENTAGDLAGAKNISLAIDVGEEDGGTKHRDITLQVIDANGDSVSGKRAVRWWTSSSPAIVPTGDLTVATTTTGAPFFGYAAKVHEVGITDVNGTLVIDTAGAAIFGSTLYFNGELAGFVVSSAQITWSAP